MVDSFTPVPLVAPPESPSAPLVASWESFALGVVSLLVLLVVLKLLRRHMERRKASRALGEFYRGHGVT